MVGLVSVLLVRVSVVALPTRVSFAKGIVITSVTPPPEPGPAPQLTCNILAFKVLAAIKAVFVEKVAPDAENVESVVAPVTFNVPPTVMLLVTDALLSVAIPDVLAVESVVFPLTVNVPLIVWLATNAATNACKLAKLVALSAVS